MKKILSTTLLALMLITLFSCSKKDDVTPSAYQGNWTGTYSGQKDNGIFSIVINSIGAVSGTTTSTNFSQTFDIKGNVSSSGQFSATAGTSTSGATFSGQMTSTSATGTWSNSSLGFSGNWTGTKK